MQIISLTRMTATTSCRSTNFVLILTGSNCCTSFFRFEHYFRSSLLDDFCIPHYLFPYLSVVVGGNHKRGGRTCLVFFIPILSPIADQDEQVRVVIKLCVFHIALKIEKYYRLSVKILRAC